MTDLELLQQWRKQQDADAFRTLVMRHSAMMFGAARRILRNEADAEEVVQEAFLVLAEQGVTVRQSLAGWLHRVVTNRALNRLKSSQQRERREDRYAQAQPQSVEQVNRELQLAVDEELQRLPDQLREPLVLHFLEARTHQDIAESLGEPRTTITSRIAQGLTEVRQQLRKRGLIVSSGALSALLAEQAGAQLSVSALDALGKLAIAGPAQTGGAAAGHALGWGAAFATWKAVAIILALLALGVTGVALWSPNHEVPPPIQAATETPQQPVPATPLTREEEQETASAAAIPSTAPLPYPFDRSLKPLESGRSDLYIKVLGPDQQPAAGAEFLLTGGPVFPAAPHAVYGAVDERGHGVLRKVAGTIRTLAGRTPEAIGWMNQFGSDDPHLQLERSWSVRGRVVNAAGEPVEDAAVYPVNRRWADLATIMVQRSGADGSFIIPQLAGDPWELQVIAAGYGAALVENLEPDGDYTITLPPPVALEVRAVDESGAPIPDAQAVVQHDRMWLHRQEAATDARGAVTFAAVSLGPTRITATHRAFFGDFRPTPVEVTQDQQVATVVMRAARTLAGRLLAKGTDAPVAGAEIRAYSNDTPLQEALITFTGTDGAFTLSGIPHGIMQVMVQLSYQCFSAEIARLDAEALPSPLILHVEMEEPRTFEGRVVDEQGNAIPGAEVYMSAGCNEPTVADGAGHFALTYGLKDMMTRTRDLEVRVLAPGFARHIVTPLPESPATIVLTREARLSGILVDGDGKPQERMQFRLQNLDDPMGSRLTRTGWSGEFEFTSLPPARYAFRGYEERIFWHVVELAAGDSVEDLVVNTASRAVNAGIRLQGQVVSPTGAPLKGVQVRLSHLLRENSNIGFDAQSTDANGHFVADGLNPGEYNLSAWLHHGPGGSVRQKVQLPLSSPLRIVLEPGEAPELILRGRVVDAATGRPLANARLRCWLGNVHPRQGASLSRETRSRADGTFSFDNVGSGPAVLLVLLRNYGAAELSINNLPGQEVLVELGPAANLRGMIADESGHPVPGAVLTLNGLSRDEELNHSTKSTVSGTFEMPGIMAGSHTLGVWHASYAPTSVQVNLVPGDNKVAVTLDGGASLVGMVYSDAGPVAGARVMLQSNDAQHAQFATADDAGLYRLEKVMPGSYILYVNNMEEDGVTIQQDLLLSPGAAIQKDLHLPGGTSAVHGVLSNVPTHARILRIEARIETPSGTVIREVRLEGDGVFEISHLPSGTGTLTATFRTVGEGRYQYETPVFLTDGKVVEVTIDLTEAMPAS